MKETLTIEHLAPYLPYGLKILNILDDNIYDLYSLSKGQCVLNLEGYGHETFWINKLQERGFRLLLFRLSDLTKEIEHNGERFVPMDVLKEEMYLELENVDYVLNSLMFKTNVGAINILSEPFDIIQYLHKWHFDTQNLIEKELAIDINTLNK